MLRKLLVAAGTVAVLAFAAPAVAHAHPMIPSWKVVPGISANCIKGETSNYWRVDLSIGNPEGLPMNMNLSASSNPIHWDKYTPGTQVPANTTITGYVIVPTSVSSFSYTGSGEWFKNVPYQDENGHWHDKWIKQDHKDFSKSINRPEECKPVVTTTTTVAPTTTTTEAATTTTTVAATTTTAVVDTTTTANVVVPTETPTTVQPVRQTASPVVNTIAVQTMPETGSDTGPLLFTAGTLFVLGVGLLIMKRMPANDNS